MKGRKPKPIELRVIEGNREHRTIHPERQPTPNRGRPPRPRQLNRDGRKAWNYLVKELEKMRILASSDRGQMAGYCDAWALWCKAKRKLDEYAAAGGGDPEVIKTASGNYMQNPWLTIANRAMADVIRYGGELGLNPVQRTRINLERGKPKSRREALLG